MYYLKIQKKFIMHEYYDAIALKRQQKKLYLLYIRVKIVVKHIQFFRHVIERFQVHDLFLVREVQYCVKRSIIFGFPKEITIYRVHNFSLKDGGNDNITIDRIVSFDDFTVIDYIAYLHD